MRHALCSVCVFSALLLSSAALLRAEDWPAYRHDNGRTAATSETIAANDLTPAWTYRSPQPPRKAWYGPARWDAYRRMGVLGDCTSFDAVYHVIAAGDSLYYGSSSDDAVHCIDAKTGKVRWSFTTGGPVRLPPSFHNGKLYFGSDDGYAYCITADKGRLVWRFSPSDGPRKIFNDSRLISRWPVRTGVAVQGNTAYFAAGLLPWNESFLCAVDAATGKPDGKGRFVRRTEVGRTFMGMMALNDRYLLAPQGRNGGRVFRMPDLGFLGGFEAGYLAMLAGDHRVGGPGTRQMALVDVDLSGREKNRVHNGRLDACYAGDKAYLINLGSVTAFDRAQNWKQLWNAGGRCRSVIAAGGNVFVGGIDEVRAYDAASGKQVWKARTLGEVYGLAVANGALYASTTDGLIYCFRPNAKEITGSEITGAADERAARARAAKEKADKAKTAREDAAKKPVQVELAAGPFLQFTSPTSAVVRWTTKKRSATILEYGSGGRLYRDDKPKLAHEAVIDGLRPVAGYNYKVKTLSDGQPGFAAPRNFENFYNYTMPGFDGVASPYPDDALTGVYAKAAEEILSRSKFERGICFVLANGDGRLAFEIARRSKLVVIGLEKDTAKVAAARAAWQKTGRYGVRLSVQKVDSYDELPIPSSCANLVVSGAALTGGKLPGDAAEVCRILRPLGGRAVIGQPPGAPGKLGRGQLERWLARASLKKDVKSDAAGLWAVIRRPDPLPGSGEWSHQYGRADNSAYGGEELQGARKISDMSCQWIGRPGPRFHPERQVRKPAPLVKNGRLFYQGLQRLIAVDIFNGAVLWSLEIPGLQRYNMPRDGGNYSVDDDHVYLAHRGHCWKIDVATGRVARLFDVQRAPELKFEQSWSHVAMAGKLLIGSSARSSSSYTNYWSRDAWYDDRIGPGTGKICSANLFAMDTTNASVKWIYNKNSAIINSSITIGGGRIYFVEMRTEKLVKEIYANHWGRLYGARPGAWHVALDAKTGRVLWERAFAGDVGETLFYQAYAKEKLITVSSTRGYRIHAFKAASGDGVWSANLGVARGNHGGTMQRPIIVDETLYLDTSAFNLQTGKRGPGSPLSSCGTKAASKHALFYRHGDIQMWERTGKSPPSRIVQIRPDCWLSVVPGSGMLLAPEGGGGCSCGGGLRTSLGLIPRTDLPRFAPGPMRFLGSMTVEIDKALSGQVHYTTDGSDPTLDSAKYATPIKLTESAVIKARAKGKGPGPELGPRVWRRYEKVRPKRLATAAKVNFQPNDTGPKAKGFLIDAGGLVGLRENGYTYGWTAAHYRVGRWKKDKDPALDTVMHFPGPVEWVMAVENGKYEVTLGIKAQKDNRGVVAVCGVEFKLTENVPQKEWKNYKVGGQVEVKDGILRVGSRSGRTHVTFIEFKKL